ncbi:hypothetical protein Agub_g7113 [Astrephomene gubernaculifera]|uniref:Uncharacterized protein n=1 Tax=Astrephomene gubernaculifera TaxID=47775 RepID=A0AAD3HM13_9CHLO|nr:hypothetical protein Agub_g7113 [Astrephomene gubernaculifera]
MVVGICSVPEMISPKKRCSEGSPNGLRTPKRCREEASMDAHESLETTEPIPAVVMLGENGGIWHVDGLLELLAGALCATLGADPASLQLACSAENGSDDACNNTHCCAQPDQQLPPNHHDDQQHQGLTRPPHPQPHHQDQEPHPPSTAPSPQPWPLHTGLTEGNLQAHTAAAQLLPASSQCLLGLDDDDNSSVVSLSAWMAGAQTPRQGRSGSDAGSLHAPFSTSTATTTSSGASMRQLTPPPPLQLPGPSGFSFAPSPFCFTPRWGAGAVREFSRGSNGGAGSTSISCSSSSGAGCGVPEAKWPRRRPSVSEQRR